LPKPNLQQLENLATEIAALNSYELCLLQLLTHRQPMTMQVQIRHMGGRDVSLEDCSIFSYAMSQALDSSKMLTENYVLEVSSSGIGDLLINDRDFVTFKGFPIQVTFTNEDKNEFKRSGLLHQRSSDHLQLNIKGKISTIPRKEIIEVRLTSPAS
tara:strand:- start:248 stop:715 length:468 start_codon:yes stop_codon:yes gene_type:complete